MMKQHTHFKVSPIKPTLSYVGKPYPKQEDNAPRLALILVKTWLWIGVAIAVFCIMAAIAVCVFVFKVFA